jgi:TRAP-type C4-dicarboxylate transport system permease large subunit
MPDMTRRGYNQRLALGSIAAGGTLGILIPPSINLILYGAITNTSVGRLFAAGIIPGLTLTAPFLITIAIWHYVNRAQSETPEPTVPLMQKLRLLVDLLPILAIFLVVMGSLYTGFATPTEAAALGTVSGIADLREECGDRPV